MRKYSRVSSPFLGTTPISDQLQVNKTHNILTCKSLASFDTSPTHDKRRYSGDVSCRIGGQKGYRIANVARLADAPEGNGLDPLSYFLVGVACAICLS